MSNITKNVSNEGQIDAHREDKDEEDEEDEDEEDDEDDDEESEKADNAPENEEQKFKKKKKVIKPRTKSEKEREIKIKRLKRLEKRKLNKMKKLERKHWLLSLAESFSNCYRSTIGYFDFEIKYFDNFPREDVKEFKQNTAGLLWGVILTYLLFFLLVFTFRRDPGIALFFCMILLILSVFGMSFSRDMRCIFCLVGPSLASSRLRWVLLMYASVLTGLGPALNIMRNAGNFRGSITCIFDQVRLNFEVLKVIAKSPIQLIRYNIDKWSTAVKHTWRSLKDAINIIRMGIFNSGNVVNSQVNYFQFLLNVCNDKLALYNQCIIFFNNVFHNCRYKLYLIRDVCYMIRYIAKEACQFTDQINEICDNAKMKLNSFNSSTAKKMVDKVDHAFERLLREIGRKEPNLYTSEKEAEEMHLQGIEVTNISENLRLKAEKLTQMIENLKTMFEIMVIAWTIFAITYVFIASAMFRKAWLYKDSFQNHYITKTFIMLEKEACENKMPMALPLIGPEKFKYVSLDSNKWTKLEKIGASRGASFILISSISLIATIILDYVLFTFVLLIIPIFMRSYDANKAVDLDIQINGNSTIASLSKSMFSIMGPIKDIVTDVDLPICKPVPTEPNFKIYGIVLSIVFMTVLTLAFEVRILRARHSIMIAFYPERSVQRAIWLRSYIRNNRGSTKKFVLVNISNRLRKKKTKGPDTNQLSLIGLLIIKSKFMAKCLGKLGQKRVFCLSCGAEGNPKNKEALSRKFTQCAQCHSLFCKHCYTYFKNICVICHVPLDMEDTEVDLHKLSSDEDYNDFKAKYVNITERIIEHKDVPGLIN